MIALRQLKREIAAFVLGDVLGLPVDRRLLKEYELSPIFQNVQRDAEGVVTSAELVGWTITRRTS